MDLMARLALKGKLHWVLMGIICTLFLLAGLFFSYEERTAYREHIQSDVQQLGQLLRRQLGPAVLYGAYESAEEVLATLSANKSLAYVAVLNSSGELFSHYASKGVSLPVLETLRGVQEQGRFENGAFELALPVVLEGSERPVGTLVIRAEGHGLVTHMQRYFVNQLLVLVAVLVASYFFSTRIQQAIAAPYRQQKQLLMREVGKRTDQLRQANERMVSEIEERKQIEADLREKQGEQQVLIDKLEEAHNQLLQSEKMASIGQLAAGVAHEINNPVGFINSNLGTLNQYFQDLMQVLEAYEAAEPLLPADDPLLVRVQQAREQADIAYLREDIGDLLSESREGVERVKKIVQDLKDFSRSDQGQLEWCDLHQGLESTLNVAWNELKYKCEVVREFGQLPQVNCRMSQLNQVFMNLLVNAAQAIEEKGTVTLRSGCEQEWVWVEVEDSGKGMSEEVLKKVFDPFFTTKPVGKGTGLGLSLSYGIVEKHGGRIEVESEVGRGSRFRVWLPVDASVHSAEVDAALAV